MENANSKDYLEKILIQVIDNLKKTAHAPSVQSTEIPRTTLTGGTEDDEDAMDDEDEDANPDVRMTSRQFDQNIDHDGELEESDYEEQARANGVLAQPGVRKRRNIMDYQNANGVASDIEMDSEAGSVNGYDDVDDMVTAQATEANAEVNAELMEQKKLDVAALETTELGPSNAPSRAHSEKAVDEQGDVVMTADIPEPAEPEATTPKSIAPPEIAPTEPDATAEGAKQEGETERTEADVTAEASKEIAEKSQ
jgi:histone deacetylase 1/2